MSEPSNLKQLGPYTIVGILGRGGMGSVFAARHQDTGERAAIKVLAPAFAEDETFRQRFIAEIDSLKKLSHPNIVQLYGYGEHDGHLYYSMEQIDGPTLAQELSAGRRYEWREVAQIGVDIARALKHAHDHGVIHRDLKPANLLIDGEDTIKLMDFGIAKLFGSSKVTSSGSVMGTADYMAPEQAAGNATTPRCDLYSLGCVMYALLTGRPPFTGKSIAEVVHRVRYEEAAPVSELAADVPRELEAIIAELLEKDPNARIRTALSLTHRLRALQQALSISTTEQDNFSSEAALEHSQPLVVPPPDIAERPTVCLPEDQDDASAAQVAAAAAKAAVTPTRPPSWNQDHFTTVEQEGGWGESNRNEFSSAVPLMLLLFSVVAALMGGIWYSTKPLSADALHGKIMAAKSGDPTEMVNASRHVKLFMRKFPDDNRYSGVEKFSHEIEVLKIQRMLEVKARRRPETGSLSPVYYHCHQAFRAHREGDLEGAIERLRALQQFYGTAADNSDIQVKRVLDLAAQLLPAWEEKLQADIQGLQLDLQRQLQLAQELSKTAPEKARERCQGAINLFRDKPWARQYLQTAQSILAALPDPPAASTAVSLNTTTAPLPPPEPND